MRRRAGKSKENQGKKTADARRRGKIEAGRTVEAAASFTRELRDAAIKQFGQEAAPEISEYFHVEGLSLYDNFALQYVLGIDVLALGRLISVMGPPGGGKTQFCIWLAKQFIKFPGLFLYLDAEQKVSPSQFTSILQLPQDRIEAQMIPCRIDSMEDLVAKLIWYGKFYTKHFPDKIMPLYLLIDSISALTAQKAQEKAQKGEAEDNNMQAAQNAKALTNAIRTFVSEYLSKQPFFVSMITHQKKRIGGEGGFRPGGFNTPQMDMGTGGIHKDFQATWRFIITSTKRHGATVDIESAGRKVDHQLFADKCGMGEDHRRIKYTTHSYKDPETNELRMDFDFDSALIRLLTDDKKTGKKFLQSKIGLVKKAADEYNVNALKLQGLTMREAGRAINESAELIGELQKFFRISHHATFGQEHSYDPELAKVDNDDGGFD